jgi:Sugar phosphate isomerases/epimerases
MLKPLAVQLYSLRDYSQTKEDFISVVKRVADIGYKAVEPAGFHDMKPAEFKKLADDLGLEIHSSHSPWAGNVKDVPQLVDDLGALGLDVCVCGYGPDDFKDLDAIKRTADNTSAIADKLAESGITLFQHNHYWEFERIDGKLKYEYFRELAPKVKYQIDCFWSTNKGTENAVEMLKIFAKDTILLHIKDGVCRQQAAVDGMKNGLLDMKIDLMPLGTGDLPIKDIVATMPASVRAIVVELDYVAEGLDMWESIEKSYKFMTSNGLAAGNK